MNGVLGLRIGEPIFRSYLLQELQLSTRIFRVHWVRLRLSPSVALNRGGLSAAVHRHSSNSNNLMAPSL